MAMLEEELYIICKKKNIPWPKMFKRFIDDGFGVIKVYWLMNLIAFFAKIFSQINGNLETKLLLWTFKCSREKTFTMEEN